MSQMRPCTGQVTLAARWLTRAAPCGEERGSWARSPEVAGASLGAQAVCGPPFEREAR